MPEECYSGAPLESARAQGSVVVAAYRGDPTGEFSKGFLVSSSALLEGTIPKTIIVWYVQIVVETAGLKKRPETFRMTPAQVQRLSR